MLKIEMTDEKLETIIAEQPFPLLFASVTGSHTYGFSSADSDVDVRGVHVLPLGDVIGLNQPRETIETMKWVDNLELDLVTHDARKFCELLIKKSGNSLEQLYSPLVIHTTPEHAEMREIFKRCITRHHAHHYFGFARTELKLFEKEPERRVKPLLYIFRVLLTGINLMQTGEVEASLLRLNEKFKLPFIPELVERKARGAEQEVLPITDKELEFYRGEYERLINELERARDNSDLPDEPLAKDDLSDLLVRARLKYGQ